MSSTTAADLSIDLEPKRPRRLVLLLGVAAVLLAAAVVAVVFIHRIQQHLDASAHYRAFGAKIDWDWSRGKLWTGGRTEIRFTRMVGFPAITGDRPLPAPVSDADLAGLNRLNHVIVLDLSACEQITDRGMSAVAQLDELTELYMSATDEGAPIRGPTLTDLGLARLSGLTSLKLLAIDGSRVTDRGLAALKNMKSLEFIDLSSTGVTDAALQSLAKLPKLRVLRIERTAITPEAAARFQAKTGIEVVDDTEADPSMVIQRRRRDY
jgi:hypothetical protein